MREMTVAALGDLHLCEDRLAEQAPVLAWIAKGIEAARPDLIFVAGDLSGRTVPHRATPAERNALVSFLVGLPAVPRIVVRGNHDTPGDWEFLNRLPDCYYAESPVYLPFASTVALPWVDRVRGEDHADLVQHRYTAALDEALAVSAWKARPLVLGHAALVGAKVSASWSGPTADPMIPVGLLPTCIAAFGHYHLPQRLPASRSGSQAFYVGSPFVWHYGEPCTGRGWLLLHRRADGEWTGAMMGAPVDLWVPRVLLRVRGGKVVASAGTPAGLDLIGDDPGRLPPGLGHVRLVVEAEDEAAAERAAALWRPALAEVARTVQVVAKVPRAATVRAGAEAVAAAPSLGEKMSRFWDGLDPPPSRKNRERATDLLAELAKEAEA
jgi:hypothetical protein